MKLRTPIKSIGGKYYMSKFIVSLFPEHKTYVEVFGGGASVLLFKNPSKVEVFNDINSDIVNFFRVLRDPEKFKIFYEKIKLFPYSREEFYFCRDSYKDEKDEIEKAIKFFVVARQSFSSNNKTFGFSVSKSCNNMASTNSSWISAINLLPEISNRLMTVQIENEDFRKILKNYDSENTLFYLDPPYVMSTRKGKAYDYEMSDKDHENLVDILLNIKGKAILSGYKNGIYEKLESNGWKVLEYETLCWATPRTKDSKILGKNALQNKIRLDCLWISPNVELKKQNDFL